MVDLKLEKKLFLNNVKILSFNSLLLAMGYVFAIIFMINKSYLTQDMVTFIGEQFFSPIGIIMYTRIPILEYEMKAHEIIYSKISPYFKAVLYRIIITSIELILILSCGFIILKFFGGRFDYIVILLGTFVTSFYLGTMGMLFSSISKQTVVGYLVPFIYYFFELFSKGKYTKNFYLFGMTVENYMSKFKLLGIGFIILIACLFIIRKES